MRERPGQLPPNEFGAAQPLPGPVPRRKLSSRLRRPLPSSLRWRAARNAARPLRIPAPSHIPSLQQVARAAWRGTQTLLVGAAALSFVGAGFIAWDLWASGAVAVANQNQATASLALDPALALPAPKAPKASSAPAPTQRPEQPDPKLLIGSASYKDSQPVGRILIPAIKVDYTFVYGTDLPQLAIGPGLWKWGVMPGEPGNSMISGHRNTYSRPFHDLHLLKKGDKIRIKIPGKPDAVYAVRGTEIVLPADVQVSDQVDGVRLTLSACHPIGSAAERIIVQAELIEGENLKYAVPAKEWKFQK